MKGARIRVQRGRTYKYVVLAGQSLGLLGVVYLWLVVVLSL